MKIINRNLNESIIKEADDNNISSDDLIIDTKADSVEEIADIAQDTVEVASEGDATLSDADAQKVATEIKQIADEVGADKAVVSAGEDKFITENALSKALDHALTRSKTYMRRHQKVGSNILVSGLPGSGKTAIVEQWAKEKGVVLVPMNAADAKVDAAINGMPLRDTTVDKANEITYVYAKEKLGPLLDPANKGNCVLFVDEFNRQRDQQLRRSFLSMFNEKRNADGKLDFSENLLFTVVCINPAVKEDKGAERLNQAEKSRFVYTLKNFDSDVQTSKNYFTADIANKLAKLGVDAQEPIKKLYGIDLKTQSGNKRNINTNVEKDEYWEEDVLEYIKILDLAMHILSDPSFKFDSEAELSDIYTRQNNILNQRLLTDGLFNSEGEASVLNDWFQNESDILDEDKEIIEEILDSYNVDLQKLKNIYGLNGNVQVSDDHQDEDDSDLFNKYNTSSNGGNLSPDETINDLNNSFDLMF